MTGVYEITIRHTFDAGHRVVGHEGGKGKCARLHGHTYGAVVTLAGDVLDETGFVVDFGDVKKLVDEWDHRLLLWEDDPLLFFYRDPHVVGGIGDPAHDAGIVRLPFNPTAENMAASLALRLLELPNVVRASVTLSETPKTAASFTASPRGRLG